MGYTEGSHRHRDSQFEIVGRRGERQRSRLGICRARRAYGFYSSRQRTTRCRAQGDCKEQPLEIVDPEPEAVREAKRRWAVENSSLSIAIKW